MPEVPQSIPFIRRWRKEAQEALSFRQQLEEARREIPFEQWEPRPSEYWAARRAAITRSGPLTLPVVEPPPPEDCTIPPPWSEDHPPPWMRLLPHEVLFEVVSWDEIRALPGAPPVQLVEYSPQIDEYEDEYHDEVEEGDVYLPYPDEDVDVIRGLD